MRTNRIVLGVCLALAFLFAAQQADAGAWCTTRNKCHWYAKKFTANTQVGCIGLGTLCYQHSGDCDWTANLNCGWRNCIWGGGNAAASNGWNGCWTWTSRSGQGVAGDPTVTAGRDDDQGSHDVNSHAEFDDATQTVTITLDSGKITALQGGLAGHLDVYVLREDVDETQIKEGEDVPEPEPTPMNTLWHGSIILQDGQLALDGFAPDAFKVTTDDKGLSEVTFENVKAAPQFKISDVEFGNLVVRVMADEQ